MVTTTTPPARPAKTERASGLRNHAGWAEYFGVALGSLMANKLRSFLTLLGIIIGIASIIAVVCIIQGLDQYWKDRVSNLGPNTFVITQYPIATNLDKVIEMQRRNPDLRVADAEAVRRYCTACEEVGISTHREVTAKSGGQTVEQVLMRGITPNIMEIEPFDVALGRTIVEWEAEHSRFVAFIGSDLADKFFPTVDPIGKRIQLGDHWYTVVGVAEKRGSVFGISRDNFAMVPLSTFQKIYGARRTVHISIKARPNQIELAQDQSRFAMRQQHQLGYNDEEDFGVITTEGVNELFDNLTSIIFSVSLFVVGISLVVGGIVIMNIMLVSVVERTKEIGIRKAVGARQQDVVNQFLIESVVLCCAGGVGGIIIAYGISWLIAHFTPLPSTFPLWAPLLAFTLSTIIGVFFGIYPARQASRLDPIEALRAE